MKRVVVVLPLVPVTAAMGIRPSSPSGKSVATMASPTGREMPTEGCKCIRKPGDGVDLHDHAALLFQRGADIGRHDVDAGNVQADHLGRFHGAGRHLGMDPLGHVDGRAAGAQVAVAANEDDGAGGRDGIGRVALIGQNAQGHGVELDLAQDGGVMLAAARVEIDRVDQFANRPHAVAQHLGRLAAGRGHDLAAHDQEAIIVARARTSPRPLACSRPRRPDRRPGSARGW